MSWIQVNNLLCYFALECCLGTNNFQFLWYLFLFSSFWKLERQISCSLRDNICDDDNAQYAMNQWQNKTLGVERLLNIIAFIFLEIIN